VKSALVPEFPHRGSMRPMVIVNNHRIREAGC
jgi:hypothetical protein